MASKPVASTVTVRTSNSALTIYVDRAAGETPIAFAVHDHLKISRDESYGMIIFTTGLLFDG